MITGLTLAEASTPSFKRAVIESVSEVLGLAPGAVTGNVVIGNRRSLLSSVSMMFAVSIVSDMTNMAIIRQLHQAMSSGAFLVSLNTKSASPITSVTSISISDATPTSAPTAVAEIYSASQGICICVDTSHIYNSFNDNVSMSTGSPSSQSNAHIGSVAGGTIGAFFAILICAVACYCLPWKRDKFSPVHSKYSHYCDADMIPETLGVNPALADSHDVAVTSYEI